MQTDTTNRKRLGILTALHHTAIPLSSPILSARLDTEGLDVSERSVRLYLRELQEEGLVESHGKRGCVITPEGTAELHRSMTLQRIGFLSAKIDKMTYCMGFDLHTRSGDVVVNTSIVKPQELNAHVDQIGRVFERGYAMGRLLALLAPGERVGDTTVPPGRVGFCTVCSVTVNGVLLKHGIPMHNRFGGLLSLRHGDPVGFIEIINYDGTSIDPLEVFIRSGMTDYLGAISTGDGRIGASFREIPEDSCGLVRDLAGSLDAIGLGAVMEVGQGGRPLLDIPVSEGRAGAIVCGGLNPIAILEEQGHRVDSWALAGLMEYNRLFRYEELPDRLKTMLA